MSLAARLSVCCLAVLFAMKGALGAEQAADGKKQIRVGIIGLDTSHVAAFTTAINKPDVRPELAGLRIVAAFPGGSPDIPTSIDRVPGFTEKVQSLGVEIVPSIDALLVKVDAVLLESVDGRPHLEQVKPVLKAGKPVFIDKPAAGSLADAIEIYRLAKEARVPVFSTSSLRYYPGVQAAVNNPKVGDVIGCVAFSPCSLEPHHPDLYWYGIHGCEILFTIMGPGCQSVQRTHTDDTDVVTGVWRDGRVGTFRGLRSGKHDYGGIVFGSNGNLAIDRAGGGYEPMLVEVAKFFETGVAPVSPEQTIEIMAFMEAADESKRQGGYPVTIESVLSKAREQNSARAEK